MKVKAPCQSVAAAVSVQDPAARALVSDYAWAYRDGEYLLVHMTIGQIQAMESWEGVWLLAEQDCDLVISVGDRSATGTVEDPVPPTVVRSPEMRWTVGLKATAGEAKDRDNYLGVADRAYQIANPPSIWGYVDLRFASPLGAELAADFRDEALDTLTWDVEVETDLKDTWVTVSWPDLSQVPRTYRLALYDLDANSVQQMRTTSAYAYNSGQGGVRHFRIEVNREPAGMLMVTAFSAQPSRGGTTITYVLSQEATVTVEVYSAAGTPVRILARDLAAAAGENTILWDERDHRGRLVPSGIYLCEITASSQDGQSVRASRTVVVLR